MTTHEPSEPKAISEFDRKLQQVFQKVTTLLLKALKADEEQSGGYLQRFELIGGIEFPNMAFRLIEKNPKMVDGRHRPEQLIVHVPADETGERFLEQFWINHIGREGSSALDYYDRSGVTLVAVDDGSAIALEEFVDDTIETNEDEEIEKIGKLKEYRERALGELSSALDEEFELTTF